MIKQRSTWLDSIFCFQNPISLAGVIKPLFLEINYFFGRKGLGGSEKYYKILQDEIDNWIKRIKNGPIRL